MGEKVQIINYKKIVKQDGLAMKIGHVNIKIPENNFTAIIKGQGQNSV